MKTLMILLSMTASVAADNAPFHVSHPDCDINSPICWYHVGEKPVTQDERIQLLLGDEGAPL